MKKVLSILLSAIICITSFAMPAFSAQAKDKAPDDALAFVSNPYYEGREIATAGTDAVTSKSATATYKKVKYYGKGKELYKGIRNNLEKRSRTFEVHFLSTGKYTTQNAVRNLIDDFYTNATDDSISESCTDGDYLRWQMGGLGVITANLDYSKNGYYYYTLSMMALYYTTADEEKELNAVVNNFVASLEKKKLSDYEMMREVHDFICNKTIYDPYYDQRYYDDYNFSAYGALVLGRCVCQGYALAFYRICKELGYNVRFVSSDPNEGCHAWNIVELNGKYYFVDCTWDDTEPTEDNYVPPYKFFLVNYNELRSMDSTLNQHTLYDYYYDDAYFNKNYKNYLDEDNYDPTDMSLISNYTVSLSNSSYIYNGKAISPAVTLTNSDGAKLVKNTDYTVSYSNNKDTGKAYVSLKGAGGYGGTSKRGYVINPQKMSALTVAGANRTSTSLILEWKKPAGNITGYQLQRYTNGQWITLKTITSASTLKYKITGLSPSCTYQFRVRAYKNVSKRTLYGSFSNTYITCTKPKALSVSSLSTKSKAVTVKWKKVKCSSYQIQYSTSSSMKGAKTVKVSASSASKKISKLKKGKKYYFRIRAVKTRTSGGKSYNYYTSWSSKKSIKVK